MMVVASWAKFAADHYVDDDYDDFVAAVDDDDGAVGGVDTAVVPVGSLLLLMVLQLHVGR